MLGADLLFIAAFFIALVLNFLATMDLKETLLNGAIIFIGFLILRSLTYG